MPITSRLVAASLARGEDDVKNGPNRAKGEGGGEDTRGRLVDFTFAIPVGDECLGRFLECNDTDANGANFANSSGASLGKGLDN